MFGMVIGVMGVASSVINRPRRLSRSAIAPAVIAPVVIAPVIIDTVIITWTTVFETAVAVSIPVGISLTIPIIGTSAVIDDPNAGGNDGRWKQRGSYDRDSGATASREQR